MARRELGTKRFQDPSRWQVEISLTLLLPTYVLTYVSGIFYVRFRRARGEGRRILTSDRTSY